jgi:hypothetical protein
MRITFGAAEPFPGGNQPPSEHTLMFVRNTRIEFGGAKSPFLRGNPSSEHTLMFVRTPELTSVLPRALSCG